MARFEPNAEGYEAFGTVPRSFPGSIDLLIQSQSSTGMPERCGILFPTSPLAKPSGVQPSFPIGPNCRRDLRLRLWTRDRCQTGCSRVFGCLVMAETTLSSKPAVLTEDAPWNPCLEKTIIGSISRKNSVAVVAGVTFGAPTVRTTLLPRCRFLSTLSSPPPLVPLLAHRERMPSAVG